ncbi:hydroxyacid dehydrogenase [Methylobacterium sp. NEAU 140]|uniref:hydroxyacid dehydrogenase n=1 Tax=Methylobacterium sp. NEAU 140 TaxID=3064945 RepID=UPI0027352515|nr:hydroxyacid dehydrogenase [Methylobacterium sp. NEAU 140]MDP4026667.1 hydroxyacid dehydrogenase [Methylobacterium sp. NEAU 140]
MSKILVIQPLRPEALRLFEARADVAFEVVTDVSPDNLLRCVADADALTIRDAPLPLDVVAAATRLRVISRHGVGTDNIPVAYCTARGLPVTVVGDVNAVSVAEHTLYLLLAVARRGIALDAAVRRGAFAERSRLPGLELRGRTLLLIGFGRIGREVAVRATAFGMRVLAFDPFADRAVVPGIAFVDDLDAGLRQADVVSVHVPLGPGTRGLIGAREIALLPPDAIVLNAARGGVVDEDALAAALDSGRLWGAGIDTFETEPPDPASPLARSDRTVLSPHSAALTEESMVAMGVMAARNALAGLDGSLDPALVVNREVLKEAHDARQ